MPQLIDTTPKLYRPEDAEQIAETLTANDEDGWEFRAVHDPNGTGYSTVEVYDEDGAKLGVMFGL